MLQLFSFFISLLNLPQLSEIDIEAMTPVDNYIIFYGTVKRGSPLSSYRNVSTLDNTTAMYILSALVILGNYSVGVAAVNSAGRSTVTFTEEYFGKLWWLLSLVPRPLPVFQCYMQKKAGGPGMRVHVRDVTTA